MDQVSYCKLSGRGYPCGHGFLQTGWFGKAFRLGGEVDIVANGGCG